MSDLTTITTIKDYVQIAKDVIVGLSALGAAIIAYFGLTRWWKELKGKSEYTIAKEVLKSVYRVREAFKHVRNPAIHSYEYPDNMIDHWGHLKPEHDYEGTAHVYEQRWKFMDEAFHELEEKNLEAQVEWGPEFENLIHRLRQCRAKLLVTIRMMLDEKKNPHLYTGRSPQGRMEERDILYYDGDDIKDDTFTPKVNEGIRLFEEKLRPHIRR